MAIDFPSSPTNGQVYGNWIYDSSITAWRNVNTDAGIGTLNAMGLKNVVPTSINVGSGSASYNANGTVTFTGATSISLNNVFSSTYNNYKIVFTCDSIPSGTTNANFRFRASGTDYSTGSYSRMVTVVYDGGTTTAAGQAAQTQFQMLALNVGNTAMAIMDINSPNIAVRKQILFSGSGQSSTGVSSYSGSGWLNNAGTYDGFTIYTGTGTFTGSITVYGYTN